MNERKIEKQQLINKTFHDFRKDKLRWGWNGIWFNVHEDKRHADASFIGRGVKDGDYIIIEFPNNTLVFEASKVEYDSNPPDSFSCLLTLFGVWEDEDEELLKPEVRV